MLPIVVFPPDGATVIVPFVELKQASVDEVTVA
jgi:hypothetical protein